jgi:glycosyltransferase involved in cell wall biosynthesis
MNYTIKSIPFVSIIMPVRNEVDYIDRSLAAVFNQDYPAERTEIIIADGMSTDSTREIIGGYKNSHPNLQLIDNPGKIVPTGINAALRLAHGEMIIRVDGHCEIAPDYVRRCVAHLLEDQVEGVGGSIETIGETYSAKAVAVAMSSRFGVGGAPFRTIKERTMLVDSVAFPAYTRNIISVAGPYDEELVRDQDDEYNYRIRQLGGNILLAADVHSRYYSRSSLRSLWKQYFQYGYWKVRVLQKHPRQMQLRQFVPPAFVAALIIFSLLAFFSPASRFILAFIAGSYLVVNLLASTWTAAHRGWQFLPLLPLVYIILHLSYGLGFLVGLFKFINRWGDKRGAVPTWQDAK